jgi:hypothetical protein
MDLDENPILKVKPVVLDAIEVSAIHDSSIQRSRGPWKRSSIQRLRPGRDLQPLEDLEDSCFVAS